MAKKRFLNRAMAIPTAVNRDEEVIATSSSRRSQVSETTEQLPFMILDETSKYFQTFIATGLSLFIKFKSPGEEQEPTVYLKEWVTALTNYTVDKVPGGDLVGLRIRNTENVQGKVVVISLRRRDQLKLDVVWSVLGTFVRVTLGLL